MHHCTPPLHKSAVTDLLALSFGSCGSDEMVYNLCPVGYATTDAANAAAVRWEYRYADLLGRSS
jgi:hypothetical protein